MIKLFASDLDGTLLNALHMVDPTIRRALHEVTASGAHFAMATGRTMRTPQDYGFTGVDAESVCCNGAIVLDRTGKVIHHSAVDPTFIEELLRAFPAPRACFEFVGLEQTFVSGTPDDLQAGYRGDGIARKIMMTGMRARRRQMSRGWAFSQPASEICRYEICKVNARTADEGLERELHAFLGEHADTVVNTPFNPVMFEITDARVNKGEAVAWLAGYLGIRPDEVAVYGDGGNDIAMLERFEHAYATSNASDAAKRAAGPGHVIGSCAFHAVPKHMVRIVRGQRADR